MRRRAFAFIAALCLCSPALADDNKDCFYWRLGKDDAEKASRRAACDRIIAGKGATDADRAVAYAERASWDERDNRRADAIADFDHALALDPSQIEWQRRRAYLLYFEKQYDRAIKDFDAVLAVKPKEAHVTFFRGLAWLDKKDEARGFADLAKGIELDPNDYWYPYQRAVELAERGRAEEALPDLDKAIAIKGSEVNPYLLRADIRDKRGETDKALADLTRIVEIEPKRASAYMNRANIYERMGQLIYERMGQLDRAIADYDTLISLNPGDNYYVERKAGLAAKLAARGGEPPPAAEPVVPAAPPAQPTAPAAIPPTAAPQPPPAPKKEAAQAPDGKHECRRFDAIANRTISVACPD
jgi:tetratricopeptide (TPR) repeat protein